MEQNDTILSGRPRSLAEEQRQLRHDLRSLVGQIIGYAEILLETGDDSDQESRRNDLERIRTAGQRIITLLNKSVVTSTETAIATITTGEPSLESGESGTISEALDSVPLAYQDRVPETGRILIVDDAEENRDLLARRLGQQGHECVTVESGEEALSLLQSNAFDVMLLDLIMPGMSGFEVLDALRQDPAHQSMCVIMISAVDETDSVVRGIEMGAADFLTKPFNPTLLWARVNSCLRDKRHRDRELRLFAELQENYQRERNIADALQRPILRPIPENAFPLLSVATLYNAARAEARVGGDLFDAFSLPGGRIALVVADVSGKGLAAAARAVQVKYALRAYALENDGSPSVIVTALNHFLCESRGDESSNMSFVCLCLAIVDPVAGEVVMTNAGLEPPLIVGADGAASSIEAGSPPLGILTDLTYESVVFPLKDDDTLLICTDGLTEARRGSTFLEYAGMARLAVDSREAATLTEMGQRIVAGATAFAEDTLHDDVCLLLARRRSVAVPTPVVGEAIGNRQ
jgi:phosphoserine phosphatase RsbU/P